MRTTTLCPYRRRHSPSSKQLHNISPLHECVNIVPSTSLCVSKPASCLIKQGARDRTFLIYFASEFKFYATRLPNWVGPAPVDMFTSYILTYLRGAGHEPTLRRCWTCTFMMIKRGITGRCNAWAHNSRPTLQNRRYSLQFHSCSLVDDVKQKTNLSMAGALVLVTMT